MEMCQKLFYLLGALEEELGWAWFIRQVPYKRKGSFKRDGQVGKVCPVVVLVESTKAD